MWPAEELLFLLSAASGLVEAVGLGQEGLRSKPKFGTSVQQGFVQRSTQLAVEAQLEDRGRLCTKRLPPNTDPKSLGKAGADHLQIFSLLPETTDQRARLPLATFDTLLA